MDVARRTAQLSYAEKLKVGSIIVKDDSIISFGYNGTPKDWDNIAENKIWMSQDDSENLTESELNVLWPYIEISESYGRRYNLKTKDEVIHAEMNSIAKLAKSNHSGYGAIMFITHSPCIQCAKGIYTAGLTDVYYDLQYRDPSGIEFLKKCGLNVVKV